MKLFIQAVVGSTFFRAGRGFTFEGGVFDTKEFSEKQLEALRVEKNLHVREATKEEIAEHAKLVGAVAEFRKLTDGEVANELTVAIRNLAPEAFGSTGVPTLKALRAAVDIDPEQVNDASRDAAMKVLSSQGFKAPVVS